MSRVRAPASFRLKVGEAAGTLLLLLRVFGLPRVPASCCELNNSLRAGVSLSFRFRKLRAGEGDFFGVRGADESSLESLEIGEPNDIQISL